MTLVETFLPLNRISYETQNKKALPMNNETITYGKTQQQEEEYREGLIVSIINSQFRGVRMDDIYFRDRYRALEKLTTIELEEQLFNV